MQRLVRPGMAVADIGTQYGYFTLLLADLVGDAGKVYVFDPDPVSLKRSSHFPGRYGTD
jgi:predicted methyltransferase